MRKANSDPLEEVPKELIKIVLERHGFQEAIAVAAKRRRAV